MAVEALLVSQFVAAGAMLLLAGWLLWLNFRSTVNRAFALFLFLRAMVIIANRMRGVYDASDKEDLEVFWQSIREYYYLALAPALAYFWVAYRVQRNAFTWKIVVVVLAVAIEASYAYDHCLDYCVLPSGLRHLGPLSWLSAPGHVLAGGLVGLAILVDALRHPSAPRSQAAFPVAVGLLLASLLEASLAAGLFSRLGAATTFEIYDGGFWPRVLYGAFFVGGILCPVLALASLLWKTQSMRDARTAFFAVMMVLIGFSGFYVGWNVVAVEEDWLPGLFIQGLWRILLPALVAYALVRHRLFGVEVRLRWTLVRGTMAFTFLAVFFVAAQLAQNYLTTAYGWAVGGVTAGLLLFAISPLQKMAENLTQAVLPHGKPVASMTDPEKISLFRQQAALVWSDGAMGRKERALLDGLRDRLGIPLEEAVRIEAEAATAGIPAVRRPSSMTGS